jgi:hypothetical protein
MANIKISALPDASSLNNSDVIPIVQTTTKKSTFTLVKSFLKTYFDTLYGKSNVLQSLTPSGTTQAIDWNNGNFVNLSLASASGNVTLTFSNPFVCNMRIKVTQHASSPKDLIFPSGVKWLDTSTGLTIIGIAGIDYLVQIDCDGTNYLAGVNRITS